MAQAPFPLEPERGRHIPGIGDMTIDEGELPPDERSVIERADGSALITDPEPEKADNGGFYANLAVVLPEDGLQSIAADLLKKVERDKESRKRRDEQYEEGLRRTGLGQDAPGGAQFVGASRVVHPMLAEACVDFAASSMREMFPPNGPVRTKIEGKVTKEKLEVAERQSKCMNWQLTEQIAGYPDELEQLLTQLPMGGSQYLKMWWDTLASKPCVEFVPIDDMLLPFAATDFYSAVRITHVQRVTQETYEDRVESSYYRDVETEAPGRPPEQTKSAKTSNKIEGKEETIDNIDGLRMVYEVNTFLSLEIDGTEKRPYLVSVCDKTRKVLALYRNWDDKAPHPERLHWIIEFGFIPWRGAYKIGLPHLIGGLSAAATGALRALLDTAHINNQPGALKLKGARVSGQSRSIEATEVTEMDGGPTVDDIRKLAMPLPFKEPSPVLFQLLGWLDNAAKGVVTTAEEKISEANSQMPVGTTLALIEQGAKVFSSIHARLHRSQHRLLQILARLNAKNLTPQLQIQSVGEVLAQPQDFASPLSVQPVSDPNIFSETQRYAQMQMVLQLATGQATAPMHDLRAVVERMYKLAKIPDIEQFLPKKPVPMPQNAAAENSAAMMGQPLTAFPEQDHMAHLEVHFRFTVDPLLGGSPNAMKQVAPGMLEHIKQHMAFLYVKTMFDLTSQALGGSIGEASKEPKNAQKIDRLLAAASKVVHDEITKKLAPLGPVINQLAQEVAKMLPPPPMDPSQAALKASTAETERRAERDKGDLTIKGEEVRLKGQDLQIKAAKEGAATQKIGLDAKKVEQDSQKSQQEVMLKAQKDEADTQLRAADMARQEEEAQAKHLLDAERVRLQEQEMHMVDQREHEKIDSQREHQRLQLEEARKPGNDIPGA